MNTNDFKPFAYFGDRSFSDIFKYQKKIFSEYMKSEKKEIIDFDINVYEDQQILKDFLQIRFIEELTEATMDMENLDHFMEEMIDAFNFLIEAYIIYGWNYNQLNIWVETRYNRASAVKNGLISGRYKVNTEYILKNNKDDIYALFYTVIEQVGRACNLLKNRPWRQSQYLVDLLLFEKEFKKIWGKFNELCVYLRISKKDIFKIWSLKYQVNEYRLRTKY